MNTFFLVQCYGIGVVGNLALGPIFMLTLKRSLRAGFWHGFATAIAAALADGTLFMLSLFGLLSFVDEFACGRILFLVIGGSALLYVGYSTFREKHPEDVTIKSHETIPGIFLKTFILTILNPGTLVYFMAASVGVLNTDVLFSFSERVLLSSLLVSMGTFTVLFLVSLAAPNLARFIQRKPMEYISMVIGCVFMGFGLFFYYQAISKIVIFVSQRYFGA